MDRRFDRSRYDASRTLERIPPISWATRSTSQLARGSDDGVGDHGRGPPSPLAEGAQLIDILRFARGVLDLSIIALVVGLALIATTPP